MTSETEIGVKKRIPQLDGLRGIAILMVICYHYFPNVLLFNFGWTGVDLFFVLSGFLITGRLIPFLDDKKLLAKFYRNRFLRIVPLYVGFLIIFFSIWFLFSGPNNVAAYPFYTDHWWNYFLFIQNWSYFATLSEGKTHLLHLWSVAVEEQIYLLFPLFLFSLNKNVTTIFKATLMLCIVIPICRVIWVALHLNDDNYINLFYNTFFRLEAFLAGAIIYFLYYEIIRVRNFDSIIKWVSILSAIILVIKIVITGDAEKTNMFTATIGYTLIALLYGGFLMLTLVKESKLLNYFTSLRFMRFTGKISYGLYIIHWPLFLFGFGVVNKIFSFLNMSVSEQTIHAVNILISLPASYLVSFLSFKYYESYFLKKKASPEIK